MFATSKQVGLVESEMYLSESFPQITQDLH